MAKKAEKTVSPEGVSIKFLHNDAVLEAKLSDLSPEIVQHLAAHGLSQKLGDSFAGAESEHCETAATAVWKSLVDGKWSQRREGSGAPRVSQLAEALSRVTGQPVDACVEKVASMDDDQKGALKNHPQIKAAIAAVRAEKMAAEAAAAAKAAEEAPAGLDLSAIG